MRPYPPSYPQDIPALADPAMPTEGCCESRGGNVSHLSRFLHFACAGPGSSPPSGNSDLSRRSEVVQKIEATLLTPPPGAPSALLLSRGLESYDEHPANATATFLGSSVATPCPFAKGLARRYSPPELAPVTPTRATYDLQGSGRR